MPINPRAFGPKTLPQVGRSGLDSLDPGELGGDLSTKQALDGLPTFGGSRATEQPDAEQPSVQTSGPTPVATVPGVEPSQDEDDDGLSDAFGIAGEVLGGLAGLTKGKKETPGTEGPEPPGLLPQEPPPVAGPDAPDVRTGEFDVPRLPAAAPPAITTMTPPGDAEGPEPPGRLDLDLSAVPVRGGLDALAPPRPPGPAAAPGLTPAAPTGPAGPGYGGRPGAAGGPAGAGFGSGQGMGTGGGLDSLSGVAQGAVGGLDTLVDAAGSSGPVGVADISQGLPAGAVPMITTSDMPYDPNLEYFGDPPPSGPPGGSLTIGLQDGGTTTEGAEMPDPEHDGGDPGPLDGGDFGFGGGGGLSLSQTLGLGSGLAKLGQLVTDENLSDPAKALRAGALALKTGQTTGGLDALGLGSLNQPIPGTNFLGWSSVPLDTGLAQTAAAAGTPEVAALGAGMAQDGGTGGIPYVAAVMGALNAAANIVGTAESNRPADEQAILAGLAAISAIGSTTPFGGIISGWMEAIKLSLMQEWGPNFTHSQRENRDLGLHVAPEATRFVDEIRNAATDADLYSVLQRWQSPLVGGTEDVAFDVGFDPIDGRSGESYLGLYGDDSPLSQQEFFDRLRANPLDLHVNTQAGINPDVLDRVDDPLRQVLLRQMLAIGELGPLLAEANVGNADPFAMPDFMDAARGLDSLDPAALAAEAGRLRGARRLTTEQRNAAQREALDRQMAEWAQYVAMNAGG